MMKYQLVLQWPASSIEDYDVLISIENTLIETFSDRHQVDGHDFGSAEMNIVILTDDPEKAFCEAKAVRSISDLEKDLRVAYRKISGADYKILWPADLTEFKVT